MTTRERVAEGDWIAVTFVVPSEGRSDSVLDLTAF
jgi:hypothetical protein